MSLPQERLAAGARRIGIGDFGLGGRGESFRVTLGSCVGLCLLWPKEGRFAVAHVLLPESQVGAGGKRSRCGDTVVPFLLEALELEGSPRSLIALVAGGGIMYRGVSGADPVGVANQRAVKEGLRRARIRISGEDLGGEHPRQLIVDGPSARLLSLDLEEEENSVTWDFPPHFEDRRAA